MEDGLTWPLAALMKDNPPYNDALWSSEMADLHRFPQVRGCRRCAVPRLPGCGLAALLAECR